LGPCFFRNVRTSSSPSRAPRTVAPEDVFQGSCSTSTTRKATFPKSPTKKAASSNIRSSCGEHPLREVSAAHRSRGATSRKTAALVRQDCRPGRIFLRAGELNQEVCSRTHRSTKPGSRQGIETSPRTASCASQMAQTPYLTHSPLWRFGLAPRACALDILVGCSAVMELPSVDTRPVLY